MGSLILEFQHFLSQSKDRKLPKSFFCSRMTDLVVLTKNAVQIAMGKKNRARTPGSGDGWFLPMMQTRIGDFDSGAGTADAYFSRQTID